jgi:hypothetical protein
MAHRKLKSDRKNRPGGALQLRLSSTVSAPRAHNEDSIGDKLTEDINKKYCGYYNMNWNDYLNHWMVDYDIIRILKWHVRYTSWAAVPMKTKQLCYKHYHDNFMLPDWDTNQEKY